jgi:hypothetical protein
MTTSISKETEPCGPECNIHAAEKICLCSSHRRVPFCLGQSSFPADPSLRLFGHSLREHRVRHDLPETMFGRFGGGGSFVAQYKCYPVSFIDRVRVLRWCRARWFPKSFQNDPRDADWFVPSPRRAMIPDSPLTPTPPKKRSRNWRMETKVGVGTRTEGWSLPSTTP